MHMNTSSVTARSTGAGARLLAGAAALIAIVATALVGAPTAQAHSGFQSYVYLEVFDDAIFGRVEYPVAELNRVLGWDINEDDLDQTLEDAQARRDDIIAYTQEHLTLYPVDGQPGDWTFEYTEIRTLGAAGIDYAILDFEIEERFDPSPRTFNVEYDGIIEADSDRDAFLLIATDFGSGTFNNEANEFLRFTAGNTQQLVDLDDRSFWKGVSGTIALGVEHIKIGTDHILFILALVMPSAMVFTRRREDGPEAALSWQPSPSFTASLWRVVKIATMFTLAHSITLAIGGFEILELSPRFVEAVIAISIAIAALHNIRPIWANKEWLMAFAFGLFHGFGFAGLLGDLGLTRTNRFVSLLGFNIGVEIGQVLIILMVFPILFLMRRTRIFVPAMYAGSVVLALVSLAWASERIFDYDTNVNALVDPIFRWPRAALLLLGIFAIAAAIYLFDRSQNALRPVANTDDSTPAEFDPPSAEDVVELVDV